MTKNTLETLIKQALKEAAKPDFLDLDKDGDKEEPMKDAAKDAKEKKEEVNEETQLQEMDRYEQIRADMQARMPNASPEEISAATDEMMKSMYTPRPSRPTGRRMSQKERDAMMRAKINKKRKGLEESLKIIAKAKNIILKSSGKRIK